MVPVLKFTGLVDAMCLGVVDHLLLLHAVVGSDFLCCRGFSVVAIGEEPPFHLLLM